MSQHIKISVCPLNMPDTGLHSRLTGLNINSRPQTIPLLEISPGLMGYSDQFLLSFWHYLDQDCYI